MMTIAAIVWASMGVRLMVIVGHCCWLLVDIVVGRWSLKTEWRAARAKARGCYGSCVLFGYSQHINMSNYSDRSVFKGWPSFRLTLRGGDFELLLV